MKAIRLSFFRMLTCMRRDLMLFAACLSPVLAGLLFRFAIPPLETALRGWLCKPEILSPYYALIDLCFAMLSPRHVLLRRGHGRFGGSRWKG